MLLKLFTVMKILTAAIMTYVRDSVPVLFLVCKWFRGLVGHGICLTRRTSPVRSWAKSLTFLNLSRYFFFSYAAMSVSTVYTFSDEYIFLREISTILDNDTIYYWS